MSRPSTPARVAGHRLLRRLPLVGVAGLTWASLHGGGARAQSDPPSRTQLEVSGGVGRHQYTPACSSTQFQSKYAQGVAEFHHRYHNGFTLHSLGAAMYVDTKASERRESDPPERELNGLFGGRVGYDGRWVGGELGVVAGRFRIGADAANVFPSARVRIGRADGAYVWGSLLAREAAGLNRIAGAGVGVRADRLLITGGVAGSAGDEGTVILDLSYRVHAETTLRLMGQYGGKETHSVGVGVGFGF